MVQDEKMCSFGLQELLRPKCKRYRISSYIATFKWSLSLILHIPQVTTQRRIHREEDTFLLSIGSKNIKITSKGKSKGNALTSKEIDITHPPPPEALHFCLYAVELLTPALSQD